MFDTVIEYIKLQLMTNEFFSGAALATILGSILLQLRNFPKAIWARVERLIVYRVTVYEQSEIFRAIELYLSTYHLSKYRNVEGKLLSEAGHRDNEGDITRHLSGREEGGEEVDTEILFEHYEDHFLLIHGRRPLKVVKGREKLENASNKRNAYLISFSFYTLFGRGHIEDFLNKSMALYKETTEIKTSFSIYVSSWSNWEYVSDLCRPIESVVLSSGLKESVLADINHFYRQRDKYDKLGIPYKRTYLLHGPPGNGKTSMAAALASYLKRDLYYLNLSSVGDDGDLQRMFRNVSRRSILVLEDIDAAFDGRDPMAKITFSGLLNCLDGVFYKDELITIITTNHIEKLDSALIRKGRVDMRVEIGNPDKEQVERYLTKFYDTEIVLESFVGDVAMSEIVDLCLTHSIEGCVGALTSRN